MQDAAATGLTNPLSCNMSYGNYCQPVAQGRIRTQIVLGTINTGEMQRKKTIISEKDP